MSIEFHNAIHLQAEFAWLSRIIQFRLDSLNQGNSNPIMYHLLDEAPHVNTFPSPYSNFLVEHNLTIEERIILLLAIAPHIHNPAIDKFLGLAAPGSHPPYQVGGVFRANFRMFLPTVETALFLLAGTDIESRFSFFPLFNATHFFYHRRFLEIKVQSPDEPFHSGVLVPSQELIERFTIGKATRPDFTTDFPAQRIQTEMSWNDLVLEDATLMYLNNIKTWMEFGSQVLQFPSARRHYRNGYKALFHGPPGTGKTITAAILGKEVNKEVYRIDLSQVVSKFIGETEKNLAKLFQKAAHQDWILFFDEADALFGKRTQVKDSHDRYANQEVSYLLQRVEDYEGLVILASNNKENIDSAFARRFQSIIHFPIPKAPERLRLWQTILPTEFNYDPKISIKHLADRYELPGGNLKNIIFHCLLEATKQGRTQINSKELEEGIRNEYGKMNKLLPI